MNRDCAVVRDLLPLYVDEVCSPPSRELVEEHLKTCAECASELQGLRQALPDAALNAELDDVLHRQAKRFRRRSAIAGAIIGGILKRNGMNEKILSPGGLNGEYFFGSGELTDKVERIEIEWSSGKLELAQQEGSSIRIDERSQTELTEKQKVHWRVDGTTLHIWYSDPKTVDLLGFNFLGFNFGVSKELTVTLPESLRLNAAEISVASAEVCGTVNADKLTVDSASGSIELTTDAAELEVDTASGDARIRHSGELKIAEFDTASGAVEAVLGDVGELGAGSASGRMAISARSLDTAELSSASGNIRLACESTPANVEIDTASGSVELTLPKNADFRMEVDTASGKFRSEIPLAMQDDEYLAGSGRGEIEISTASGDITLKAGS